MSAFKYCPLIWMFSNKTSNNQINKIHKHSHRLVYEMQDANFDLRSKQLLKLPETSTSRYGTQALCFKGSLIWNTVPNKIKNIGNIEDFKKHIKEWKPTTCSCKLCL